MSQALQKMMHKSKFERDCSWVRFPKCGWTQAVYRYSGVKPERTQSLPFPWNRDTH